MKQRHEAWARDGAGGWSLRKAGIAPLAVARAKWVCIQPLQERLMLWWSDGLKLWCYVVACPGTQSSRAGIKPIWA